MTDLTVSLQWSLENKVCLQTLESLSQKLSGKDWLSMEMVRHTLVVGLPYISLSVLQSLSSSIGETSAAQVLVFNPASTHPLFGHIFPLEDLGKSISSGL